MHVPCSTWQVNLNGLGRRQFAVGSRLSVGSATLLPHCDALCALIAHKFIALQTHNTRPQCSGAWRMRCAGCSRACER